MTYRGAQVMSVVLGIICASAFATLVFFPSRAVFILVTLLLIALLILAERYIMTMKGQHTILPLLLVTLFAEIGLLVMVDEVALKWLLVCLGGLFFGLIWSAGLFWNNTVGHTKKLFRRIVMMIWAFDAFALVSFLYAISLFFPRIPFWVLALVGGCMLGCIAWLVWRMYIELPFRRAVLWMLLIALVMIEYLWVMYLLPFNFATSGFLVVWVWYLIQLLVRFRLGNKGIMWKKQRTFLLVNLVLYFAVFAFFVRWV